MVFPWLIGLRRVIAFTLQVLQRDTHPQRAGLNLGLVIVDGQNSAGRAEGAEDHFVADCQCTLIAGRFGPEGLALTLRTGSWIFSSTTSLALRSL